MTQFKGQSAVRAGPSVLLRRANRRFKVDAFVYQQVVPGARQQKPLGSLQRFNRQSARNREVPFQKIFAPVSALLVDSRTGLKFPEIRALHE